MAAWRLILPSRPPWPTSSMWTHSARLLMVHRPLAMTVEYVSYNPRIWNFSLWFNCRAVSLPDDTINICTPVDCQGVLAYTYLSTHYEMDLSANILTPYTHTQPSIIPRHLKHLHSLLPKLDISTLLRVARLFDPSLPTIRPLLVKANSHRQRLGSLPPVILSLLNH